MTLQVFSERTNRVKFVRHPSLKKQISTQECQTHGREGRGVAVSESRRSRVKCTCWCNLGSQLILKMTSENQTVDHTNKIMGNDHDHDRCPISHIIQEREDTNFENIVEKDIGCTHLRLDMCTCVRTSLVIKITRLYLLSGLGTTFL